MPETTPTPSAVDVPMTPEQAKARDEFFLWASLNPHIIERCLASPLGRRRRDIKAERAAEAAAAMAAAEKGEQS